MGKTARVAALPAPAIAPNITSAPPPLLPSSPPTMSAQPHFDAEIAEIGPTLLPPQFDTTNLELVFYGSWNTLPRQNIIIMEKHQSNGLCAYIV